MKYKVFTLKHNNKSYFKEIDENNSVSKYIWTGQLELAKRFPYDNDESIKFINELIAEGFLPLLMEDAS